MKNRFPLLAIAVATAATAWGAVQVGDSQEKVLADKGAPPGQMKAGTRQILKYPDETITLANGRVVSVAPAVTPKKSEAPDHSAAKSNAGHAFHLPGLEAKLPAGMNWKVTGLMDEPARNGYLRKFEAEGRQIVIIMGPNKTGDTDLSKASADWKRGFVKPGMKVTAESPHSAGAQAARLITAEYTDPAGGARLHCSGILAVTKTLVYTVILTANAKPVADDEFLMAFVQSLKIKPDPAQ